MSLSFFLPTSPVASQVHVVLSQPVPEELQNGEGFGYVVAFRPSGTTTWIQTVVTSPDTPRYVFRNESILPFSPYEVKVGVYNNKGEGPFSAVATVRYWNKGQKEESSNRVKAAGNETSIKITGLRSNLAYYTAVRAYNSAGAGPFTPSQPPGNVVWNVTDSRVVLSWEEVRAMDNESEVTGYKVLYRTSRQSRVEELSTATTTAELWLQLKDDYFIEVRATTEGGDGSSSEQILIPRLASMDARGSGPSVLSIFSVSSFLATIFSLTLNSVLC
ncbi:hypothetical protein DV515_00009560 [Chloebia gouldiae]|uniref:Fibronectin type-III domain-containing protein n=1 Tax=Chloebia gouldiae TaxID=44316 RepID=A0A3L8SCA3_CHLGU|nr:hypothetical protein DV515_00009560 [Chloebia gouldiae]